jgi:putative PIN family toxin of toxin-antitoxin system
MMQSSIKQSDPPLKIVVDTNLYLSLFVFRSAMLHHIFELVTDEKLTLYTSPTQLAELKTKFMEFAVMPDVQETVLFFIKAKATLLNPTIAVKASRDRADNFLLELSEAAAADYLITRDNDLLVLKHWKDTIIILPEDFLPLLRTMSLLE